MTLQIRDKRARELAEALAKRRHVTMTDAVIQALEAELRREVESEPLHARLARIADQLAEDAGPNRRLPAKGDDVPWERS